ncbi:MAG: hypothetical protein ACFE85_08495 [Candidatus Hodarchaeota archaeon]
MTTGTSPFMGASQFGKNARIYRKKFLNDKDAVLEILETCYKAGGRGIELIPGGALNDAAKIMKETYDDFVITGSTFPGPDPKIDELVDLEAKIIFVHGMVSDKRDDKLIKLIEEVSSRDVIPGVAAHNPISTLEFTFENLPDVKTFLIPFNSMGIFMEDKEKLEKIVNDKRDYNFIGMKTLAAGKIKPQEAYNYITKHNICAVTIGMVTAEEAETSTKTALKALQR